MPEYKARKVYLPLQTLDKCCVCSTTSPLQLCAACGEKIYCSQICQRKDWPTHKVICGNTDRIDLSSFYPFLACLVESFRGCRLKPPHPALKHTVINNPTNPGTVAIGPLPAGLYAKVVESGAPLAHPKAEAGSAKWWPTAASPTVRDNLYWRIYREGYSLSYSLALCIGLLTEMYTTTAVPSSQSPDGKARPRVRLRYGSSPISDFGIVKGVAKVLGEDRLAYLRSDTTFWRGQDHNEHYWIYFTTVRGETVFLDCAMAAFNLGLMIVSEPYAQNMVLRNTSVPAVFITRESTCDCSPIVKETQRFTVLRSVALRRAFEQGWSTPGFDAYIIIGFMEEIVGQPCGILDRILAAESSRDGGAAIAVILQNRAWVSWPKYPMLVSREDPPSAGDRKSWSAIIRRVRKGQRGELTREMVREALLAWGRLRNS